jgi:hypothetical protein
MIMNWKECGRKWSWPNLRYCPSIFLEKLRKTTKSPYQDRWSSGLDFNVGPHEHKARIITARPLQNHM